MAISCAELTQWKRPWCWEGLGAGGEGDDRGWDGWMASPTQWTWVWVNSRSWWWTGRPGVLRFMGSQRVGHNWATELNWTDWDIIRILLPRKVYKLVFSPSMFSMLCNGQFPNIFVIPKRTPVPISIYHPFSSSLPPPSPHSSLDNH